MRSVLFVCLGNICRSPTAEAIFNSLIEKASLSEQLFCESAGTSSYHIGEDPDPRTRQAGEARGYRFQSTARQFDPDRDFESFNWIVAMDSSNFSKLKSLSQKESHREKLFEMIEFLKTRSADEIPDPYYQGEEGFEYVLDLLEEACQGLLEKIQREV